MEDSGSGPFAGKTSEDRALGNRADAMRLAGGGYKGLAHVLCVVALVGCATGGTRIETPRCIPYYISVGINVLDRNVEDIASRIVFDAISSMGYSASANGYATPSKECFIGIQGLSTKNIEIVLYVSEREPSDQSEWIGATKEILMYTISRLGLKDQLEVLELVVLEESYTGRYQYPR